MDPRLEKQIRQMKIELNTAIDRLCTCTRNPRMLNALHACRPDHPLGPDYQQVWRNACALAQWHRADFSDADLRWLKGKAEAEASFERSQKENIRDGDAALAAWLNRR